MPLSYKIKSSKNTKMTTPVAQNSTKSPKNTFKKKFRLELGILLAKLEQDMPVSCRPSPMEKSPKQEKH